MKKSNASGIYCNEAAGGGILTDSMCRLIYWNVCKLPDVTIMRNPFDDCIQEYEFLLTRNLLIVKRNVYITNVQ